MHSFFAKAGQRVHLLRLNKGEDLLEEIRGFVKREAVRNGVVISGIGTLRCCRFHGVTNMTLPAYDEYYSIENVPMELSGLSGIIADFEPHLHMTVTTFGEERKTVCAHTESGCIVLCLAEIAILELGKVQMSRELDDDRLKQLTGRYVEE